MRTLNLGILAHVDAGKTTLTERLLHLVGVVDEIGSVDAGTTKTDSLEIERQRGITIKAAVVSFVVGDVTVNLIDTPGHPDFIAEVERTLGVLDGAVLVISAVEGVQAQTRVLMRALQSLSIPTLLFVNKIDRVGARERDVIEAVAARLTPSIVVLGSAVGAGTREARFVPFGEGEIDVAALADHDDGILAALVDDRPVSHARVCSAVAEQTKRARLAPVLFGSAITGAGVDVLLEAITELLPAAPLRDDGCVSAAVFKVERGAAGERVAFLRLFSGVLAVRQRVGDHTVTAIEVFEQGATARRAHAVGGEIAKVWGLGAVRIGDTIGDPPRRRLVGHFAPPTLETVVVARPEQRLAVHSALTQLAEQDPLIAFRYDEMRGELHLSLFGEVQKEVIQATLASDHGLDVQFRETTPICIERVVGVGESVERMPRGRSSLRPFLAGVGLRIEPGPVGSGVEYRPESQFGALPAAFMKAIADSVADSLRQGLCGWEVTDCVVTLTFSQYAPRQSHAHQGFSKAMSSIGSDFRFLTPLVLMAALGEAGTVVCEPVHRYELEIPADVLPVMVPLLAGLGAPPLTQTPRGRGTVLTGDVRAATIHALQQQIPDLTRGEGVLLTEFDSFRPARGTPPTRARTDFNPLNRREYLMRVLGAVE